MDYGSSDRQNEENLLLGISPSIKLAKSWDLKSDIAFTTNNYAEKEIIPELNRIENSWENTANVYTSPSSVYKVARHFNQYLVNLYTDYSFSIKDHNFMP